MRVLIELVVFYHWLRWWVVWYMG